MFALLIYYHFYGVSYYTELQVGYWTQGQCIEAEFDLRQELPDTPDLYVNTFCLPFPEKENYDL